MTERSLTERVRARLEHLDHLGPYSAALIIAEEVERELEDHCRRLEAMEGPVIYGRTIPAHAEKGTVP